MRLSFRLLAVAALLAGACGGNTGSNSGGTKTVNLSFIYATTAINAMQEMDLGAKEAAKELGSSVNFTDNAPPDAAPNGPAEVSMFQSAQNTSKDGIGLEVLAPDLFQRPVQSATSSNIPLVAVDTALTGVNTFVGNSNTEVGQMLATEIIKKIPADAKGQVVIGDSIPTLPVLTQRVNGMKQVIQTQRPGITIVGPFDSKTTPTDNFAAWDAEVKQYPNALAYIAPSDLDAVSLAQIEKRDNKKLLVGACDLEAAAMQAIKDGYVQVMVSPEHWLKGYIALKLLAEHALNGKELPSGWWNPGALVVDSSNVDSIIARQANDAARATWFKSVTAKQFANQGQYIKALSAAN